MAHIVGTNGNDSLVGTSGVDTIEGLGGNDTLVGLGGSDSLNGGLGNDRYVVGTGDVLSDAGGTDTIETSITWHLAAGFENLVATGSATTSHGGNNLNNHITGNAGSNWIAGREGNDTLLGGAGGDTFNMSNGAGASYGNDSIDGGTGVDTLDFGAAARTAVTVNLLDGTASGGGTAGAGTVVFVSIENVNGSAFDDSIIGNAAANFLFGFDGGDHLEGGDGNDRLEGGNGDDGLIGGEGADTLIGGAGRDDLFGDDLGFHEGDGAGDLLQGGDGDDKLEGGSGNNTLDGGLGDDTIVVSSAGDVLADAGGIDQVITVDLSWTLGDGFENLSTRPSDQGGSAASFLIGNGLNNFIDGAETNQIRIEGLGGNDTLFGSGRDGSAELYGGDGNDRLVVSTGTNTLDGGAGNDVLDGGSREDQFVFSVSPSQFNADTIIGFNSAADPDTIAADTIVLDGAAHANLGASGRFAAGDARFVAGAGLTSGQDGSDRVVYNTTTGQLFYDTDGSGAGLAQLIATLQGAPTLAATDIVAQGGPGGGSVINGTSGDDSLVGTPGDDTINGLGGNDTLVGNDGADSLNGGDGNDVVESWILGQTPGDFFADTLSGGLGDDEYRVDGEDSIAADPGGIDTVYVKNGNWTLGAGLDNLHAFDTVGSAFVLTGNELDNVITDAGSEGGVIYGMGGNDLLGLANSFNSSAAYGGDGNDTLEAARDSELFGDAGNDVLVSGSAGSFMTGGTGADTFVFNNESAVNDINDMASGSDKIQLDGDAFDAIGPSGTFAAGDPRFHSAAGATFGHDADDRIVYDTSTGNLYYDADGHFGGAATLIARLQGAPTLTASDIAVINGQDGAVINGTAGDDSMFGTPGNDTMNGLGGNDDLMGGSGDDRLDGGTGNDFLLGESGADHLIGGEGNDSLAGEDDLPYGLNDFADTLDGGVGNDSYYIHGGDEVVLDAGGIDSASINVDWTLAAGIENAELTGEGLVIHGNELGNRFVNFPYWTDDQSLPAPSTIFAGGGNDTMAGGWGGASEIFDGEAGDDLMSASGYAKFTGGAGADTFVAEFAGPLHDAPHAPFDVNLEIMDFTSGMDQIRLNAANMSGLGASGEFAAGDARFHAAAGATGGHDADDRVVYDTSSGNLWYDEDGSGSASAELIARLAGAPTFAATDIEVVNGTAGGSTINGTAGNDTLAGGAGDDTISGLAGADLLQGLGGNDSIVGGAGWDTLQGGDGNDWLQGGGWSDTMTGGAGADRFVWAEAGTNNRDTVTDFASGTDELLFENGTLTALGAPGAWTGTDGRFYSFAGATSGHDADDRIIYNNSTGALYYDADGSGAGAAQIIATFQGAPNIAVTDITVI